jgi:5-methylcytosine-specific restriction endonuclease McrA
MIKGSKHTEKTLIKMRKARAKQVLSKEENLKRSKTLIGHSVSTETRRKISLALKGKWGTKTQINQIKRLSKFNIGRKRPDVSKRFSGRNHPNWQGGKSFKEYGSEFDNQLKEQVRFRDRYKCQECGCTQLENGKQLDVHHIDYNKKNNLLINLIALCIRCHRKTNWNREYWKKRLSQKIASLYQFVLRRWWL